jgi:predicted DCC family thiol-disulfide oxidoreductase YuxK
MAMSDRYGEIDPGSAALGGRGTRHDAAERLQATERLDADVRLQTNEQLPAVERMTVLYDAGCRPCRSAKRWLASRRQAVPLEFVAAGSAEARRRFPELDPAATLRDLTVVTDGGLVYAGDAGWLACLWALDGYRGWAERFASPGMLPLARRAIAMAAGVRDRDRSRYGGTDVFTTDDCTDSRCR